MKSLLALPNLCNLYYPLRLFIAGDDEVAVHCLLNEMRKVIIRRLGQRREACVLQQRQQRILAQRQRVEGNRRRAAGFERPTPRGEDTLQQLGEALRLFPFCGACCTP